MLCGVGSGGDCCGSCGGPAWTGRRESFGACAGPSPWGRTSWDDGMEREGSERRSTRRSGRPIAAFEKLETKSKKKEFWPPQLLRHPKSLPRAMHSMHILLSNWIAELVASTLDHGLVIGFGSWLLGFLRHPTLLDLKITSPLLPLERSTAQVTKSVDESTLLEYSTVEYSLPIEPGTGKATTSISSNPPPPPPPPYFQVSPVQSSIITKTCEIESFFSLLDKILHHIPLLLVCTVLCPRL